MYDLIIIGAGPAGLTAALYAGRARLKTLVLEKMSIGGRILMSEQIENFPGFPGGVSTHELVRRMEEQVRSLGIEIEQEEALEIGCRPKVVKTCSKEYSAKAIIIATGARPRKLGIPGEDKLIGKGVSFCATCDAPFFKEKNICVVGGGNAVAEEALYLSRFARKVNIIHRRNELRASAILQEKLKTNKKIHFILNTVITEITGTAKVESLRLKDVTSSNEQSLACDGVFIYIGYDPDTNLVVKQLNLDEAGFIIAESSLATSCEGVFACGDCIKKSLYQVVTACGEGALAADSAYKYIASKAK